MKCPDCNGDELCGCEHCDGTGEICCCCGESTDPGQDYCDDCHDEARKENEV